MIKSKTCEIENCTFKVFSKNRCFFHSQKKPLKKSNKSIKKISEKGKIKKEEKKEYLKLQLALFEEHWNSKPHKCESCNKYLGEENNLCFHDHLIEKSKRKDLALEMDNLFLCCIECHQLKTNGFPTEKHRLAIDKTKEKYGK